SCTFLVGNGDGDKCDFFDHGHGSFSFSGFNLWIINLLPSGSCTTAMWQHGLSNGSAAKGTCRSFNRLIASSKFSISISTLFPSADGFHLSPTLPNPDWSALTVSIDLQPSQSRACRRRSHTRPISRGPSRQMFSIRERLHKILSPVPY